MIDFQRTHLLPFAAHSLYELISDIEAYPDFVPWCEKCTIIAKESETHLLCKMDVGFEALSTSYYCHVTLVPSWQVLVTGQGDMFHHLATQWTLTPLGANLTQVDFLLSFSLKNKVLQTLAQGAFQKAASEVIRAFEKAAEKKMTR